MAAKQKENRVARTQFNQHIFVFCVLFDQMEMRMEMQSAISIA